MQYIRRERGRERERRERERRERERARGVRTNNRESIIPEEKLHHVVINVLS